MQLNKNTSTKSLTFFFLFTCLAQFSWAQVDSLLLVGRTLENDAEYDQALSVYDQAFRLSKDKWDKALVYYYKADCYAIMGDHASAANQFELSYKKDPSDKDILYDWAVHLRQSGDIKKASKIAKQYVKQGTVPELGESLLKGIDFTANWLANPEKINIMVDKQLSTSSMEFAPMFVDSNKTVLMFSSNRHVKKGEKNAASRAAIYYTNKNANGWSNCARLDSNVNKTGTEGAVSFDHDRGVLFFTRCTFKSCGLQYSFLNGKLAGESFPILFENGVDSTATFGHPSYSQSSKILFFVSDMEGGYGGNDLWYSKYDSSSDVWAAPRNLGPNVNTPGDEMFPYIDKDNVLYFSSKGHPGMGGLDLFKWKFEETGNWKSPENLKFPYNSNGDDFGIIFQDAESGYLTSNRAGGLGSDDIYAFSTINYQETEKTQPSEEDIKTALAGVSKLVNTTICKEDLKLPSISNLKLYPNPNDGNFTFDLQSTSELNVLVRVYSSAGVLAYSHFEQLHAGANTLQFSLNSLKPGVYYLQFVSGCEPLGFQKFVAR